MSDPADEGTLWPKWLGRLSEFPVWLLGYDASISGWTEGAMPLPNQGGAVLDLLINEPRLNGQPLILVGHSLGGLVIKTALVTAATHGVPRYHDFAGQVRAVVFVATPHFGSHLANLAQAMRQVLRANPQVGNLVSHDPHLQILNEQFLAVHKAHQFQVRVFCETRGITTKRRLFGLFRGPTVTVVPHTYANPHVPSEPSVSLPEDHFSICKPLAENAQIVGAMVALCKVLSTSAEDADSTNARHLHEIPALLSHTINGCQISIVFGRIEEFAGVPNTVVVLPCSEYFVDGRCVRDLRSALGAYVARWLPGQEDAFVRLVDTECRSQLGKPVQMQKTDTEFADSYGAGRCLFLDKPLARPECLALVSSTTQRPQAGISAQMSYVFDGTRHLIQRLADARVNEVVAPIFGAGHGGIQPRLAFCATLLAYVESVRYGVGAQRLKKVTIVVFKRGDANAPEVLPSDASALFSLLLN